jgi:hypothetical protein
VEKVALAFLASVRFPASSYAQDSTPDVDAVQAAV